MNESEEDILKKFGLEDDVILRGALAGLDKMKVPPSTSKDEAWTKFEQSITMRSQVAPQLRVVSFAWVWKVAASLLLLVVSGIGFYVWNKVSYSTANNQIKEIVLPDNSTVTLNAASELTFYKFRWKTARKVRLSGEALFSITKGNGFLITTLGKTIQVRGTKFNVFSRNNYFEVKCFSGKVEVRIPRSEMIVLTKGRAVKKDAGSRAPTTYDITSHEASWIKGDFYYDGVDFNLVLDELARQFNVHIFADTMHRRYTGYFNKSDLTKALNSVCLPMGLQYRMSGDSVLIKQDF
jgi:ferric-dicitrate binding protein FerR (iron transport regulator)